MRLSKRILTSDSVQKIVCWFTAAYIRFIYLLSRWQVVRGHIPAAYWNTGKPFILAFWHGRLLLIPHTWNRDKVIHMLISGHRDGQLIARAVRHLGIDSVEGSSSKGGGAALRKMVGMLKSGGYVGITPDGPRGPRMRASEGVVALARLSGVPVIPVANSVSRRWVVGSWDRFIVALPFCRGVFVWGEPIEVPRDATPDVQEKYRQRIEGALNALCREADQLVGQPEIEPGVCEDSIVHGETR